MRFIVTIEILALCSQVSALCCHWESSGPCSLESPGWANYCVRAIEPYVYTYDYANENDDHSATHLTPMQRKGLAMETTLNILGIGLTILLGIVVLVGMEKSIVFRSR